MTDIVIHADNLGKKYTIGHHAENGRYTARRDALMQNARKPCGNKTRDLVQGKPIVQSDTLEEVWALKDVSFEIRRGEAVGIIDRNGGGKSRDYPAKSDLPLPISGLGLGFGQRETASRMGSGESPPYRHIYDIGGNHLSHFITQLTQHPERAA